MSAIDVLAVADPRSAAELLNFSAANPAEHRAAEVVGERGLDATYEIIGLPKRSNENGGVPVIVADGA